MAIRLHKVFFFLKEWVQVDLLSLHADEHAVRVVLIAVDCLSVEEVIEDTAKRGNLIDGLEVRHLLVLIKLSFVAAESSTNDGATK